MPSCDQQFTCAPATASPPSPVTVPRIAAAASSVRTISSPVIASSAATVTCFPFVDSPQAHRCGRCAFTKYVPAPRPPARKRPSMSVIAGGDGNRPRSGGWTCTEIPESGFPEASTTRPAMLASGSSVRTCSAMPSGGTVSAPAGAAANPAFAASRSTWSCAAKPRSLKRPARSVIACCHPFVPSTSARTWAPGISLPPRSSTRPAIVTPRLSSKSRSLIVAPRRATKSGACRHCGIG